MICFVKFFPVRSNEPQDGTPKRLNKETVLKYFQDQNSRAIEFVQARSGHWCARVQWPDAATAQKAIKAMNGRVIPGTGFRIDMQEDRNQRPIQNAAITQNEAPSGVPRSPVEAHPAAPKSANPGVHVKRSDCFPYYFIPRADFEPVPAVVHNKLEPNRVDIAFEVAWEAIAPVAANPGTDPADVPDPAIPKDYGGLDRRWLIIDGAPSISPFTVKSAIAGAYADLMGACYRVISEPQGNQSFTEGTYPYCGGYKRYRVSMNHSNPGIVQHIERLENGDRSVTIRAVREFFWDEKDIKDQTGNILSPKRGDCFYANVKKLQHKHFIKSLSRTPDKFHSQKVRYHGPYRFGMDLELTATDLGIKHYHRFYSETGETLYGCLPAYHFYDHPELASIVYTGRFKMRHHADPRHHRRGGPWYENLCSLEKEKDPWVYFQAYRGHDGDLQVTNMGKNFQFKATFHHEEAIPEGHEKCTDVSKLCPRCSLFGMVASAKETEEDAVGYRGRFLASALRGDRKIQPAKEPFKCQVPNLPRDGHRPHVSIKVKRWIDVQGNEICRQLLMPVASQPKASKRDIGLYFDKETGALKGAKKYRAVDMSWEDLEARIEAINRDLNPSRRDPSGYLYGHKMRQFAMVARPGISFTGTLGVEQADVNEAAALAFLLHTFFSEHRHGFQVGLGKPEGLGSLKSVITRIWVRTPKDYQKWNKIEVGKTEQEQELSRSLMELEKFLPGFEGAMATLTSIQHLEERLHSFKGADKRALKYFPPGGDYVVQAKARGLQP